MSVIYSIDHAIVDPVFFAVVPDSFMAGDGFAEGLDGGSAHRAEWLSAYERPLVRPDDRWAF